VYRRLFEEEKKEREEDDLALDAGPPPAREGDDGEGIAGQEVEWGDPSLMEGACKYEATPSGKHREPHIILW
jgi:hypothetical protein